MTSLQAALQERFDENGYGVSACPAPAFRIFSSVTQHASLPTRSIAYPVRRGNPDIVALRDVRHTLLVGQRIPGTG